MSAIERGDADNGLWLCRICHAAVDRDPDGHSAALLREWRALHDAWVTARAGVGAASAVDNEWSCPGCRYSISRGQHVCGKCRSRIFWTATPQEMLAASQIGVAVGVLAAYGVFFFLPWVISSSFHIEVPYAFGLGNAVFFVCFGFAAAGYVAMRRRALAKGVRFAPRALLPAG